MASCKLKKGYVDSCTVGRLALAGQTFYPELFQKDTNLITTIKL